MYEEEIVKKIFDDGGALNVVAQEASNCEDGWIKFELKDESYQEWMMWQEILACDMTHKNGFKNGFQLNYSKRKH